MDLVGATIGTSATFKQARELAIMRGEQVVGKPLRVRSVCIVSDGIRLDLLDDDVLGTMMTFFGARERKWARPPIFDVKLEDFYPV